MRYRPKPQPPEGPALAIELQWNQDGKAQTADAKSWIKEERSGKPLKIDWVFGGSELFVDPDSGKTIYAADSGDLITVANFTGAILDLPISSFRPTTPNAPSSPIPRRSRHAARPC